MFSSKYEYLFILGVLSLNIVAFFLNKIKYLITKKYFWVTYGIFMVGCTIIDIIALTNDWWLFNEEKICGIMLWIIPFEEFILFSLFFLSIISLWEVLENDLG